MLAAAAAVSIHRGRREPAETAAAALAALFLIMDPLDLLTLAAVVAAGLVTGLLHLVGLAGQV
jgi:hypothetical protein